MTIRGANRKNLGAVPRGASAKWGFTMMELVVSIAIFCIVILIILQAFMKVINYNRIAVQNQSLQDHTEFLFQLMSREIRTAKINYGTVCDGFFNNNTAPIVGGNQIYATSTSADTLSFINANDECVIYKFIPSATDHIGRLEVIRKIGGDTKSAIITPQDIDVEAFNISVTNFFNPIGPDRHHPATVRYYIRLNSKIWDPPIMEFTNFITARNSEQF